jgi:BirA family biotin operon repressor/biotin-[acetyl-CoA-carboxylase] ligase
MLLDDKQITNLLADDLKSLVDIEVLKSVTSTNDYLKKLTAKDRIQLCLAEQQTQGKGRLGRPWHSPFAQNIYLSCRYPFNNDISKLAGLSLMVGLAVIKTLAAYQVKDQIAIKWPNDIWWENKKLAGVLIETSAQTASTCNVIVGIGLNVNMLPDDDNAVSQPWISMQHILDKIVDRNDLGAALINHLIYYLQRFEKQGFEDFLIEWSEHDYLLGRSVTILNGNQEFSGTAAGINAEGNLLLKSSDGNIQSFAAGEASIKK